MKDSICLSPLFLAIGFGYTSQGLAQTYDSTFCFNLESITDTVDSEAGGDIVWNYVADDPATAVSLGLSPTYSSTVSFGAALSGYEWITDGNGAFAMQVAPGSSPAQAGVLTAGSFTLENGFPTESADESCYENIPIFVSATATAFISIASPGSTSLQHGPSYAWTTGTGDYDVALNGTTWNGNYGFGASQGSAPILHAFSVPNTVCVNFNSACTIPEPSSLLLGVLGLGGLLGLRRRRP